MLVEKAICCRHSLVAADPFQRYQCAAKRTHFASKAAGAEADGKKYLPGPVVKRPGIADELCEIALAKPGPAVVVY